MKILISVDFEGLAGVVIWPECDPKSPRYHHICQQATAEVNAAIAGAREVDPDMEFTVTDAHGGGTNILIDELEPTARLIRGSPRPLSMVEGVSEDVGAVFYIGYHSIAGAVSSPMDHTYSSSVVYRLLVNGAECSELDINARVAGHFGARLGLVSGNQELCEAAREQYGDAFPTVSTKRGISRFAAECRSESEVIDDVRRAAADAIRNFDNLPVIAEETPVICEINLVNPAMADVAALVPTVERTGGRSIRFESSDMVTFYHTFICCVRIAATLRAP